MKTGNSFTFMDATSFDREEPETPPEPPLKPAAWSPFLSVYESSDGEDVSGTPLREAYASLVSELYDEEFDESLFELYVGARNMHRDHVSAGAPLEDADRIVTQHFSGLIAESEAMVDGIAREFASRED